MREIWKRSTLLGKILFPLTIAVFIAQPFFVTDYSNDKTVMVGLMAKSLAIHGGIAGKEIGCRDLGAQTSGMRARWIEEFPIFPYTAAGLSKITPGDTWRRWTPWIYHALVWILFGGILLRHAFTERREILEVWGLYGALPIIVIHATKAVPDPAIIALGLAGIAVFLGGSPRASLSFFFLAALTKPLALALIAPFALGWILFAGGKLRKRFGWGILVGLVAIGGVATWLAFLYFSDIDNPLIRDAAYRNAAYRNAAESVPNPDNAELGLATVKYWSRYLTWVATRGLSWPLFLLAIAGIFLLFRERGRELRKASIFIRIATVMALFSPVFWAVVRGPQYSGPWYTLYVIPGLFTIAAYAYLRIRSQGWRAILVLITLASAIPKVDWNFSAIAAYRKPIGSAFSDLSDRVDCSVRPIIRAVF